MTPFICQIHIEKVYRISRGSTSVHPADNVGLYKKHGLFSTGGMERAFRLPCGRETCKLYKKHHILLCKSEGVTIGFHEFAQNLLH